MKSMFVDWINEYTRDNWEFVGRRVLEEARGEWSKDNPDGVEQDGGYPIYNYAYPLYRDSIEDETILRVCEETDCTVVFNNQDGKYYLALTGCGMDMSQSIALAYIIVDGCLDWDMLESIYIAAPISVGRDDYRRILTHLDRQLGLAMGNLKMRQKEVKEVLGRLEQDENKTTGGDSNRRQDESVQD